MFNPVNEDHAITSVVVSASLNQFIEPRTLAPLLALGSAWRNDLPAVGLTPAAPVLVAVGQSIDLPGIQFSRLRPDGRPLWAVRCQGRELTVECTAYTRWASIWRQAQSYLRELTTIAASFQESLAVLTLSLKVVDQFVSNGEVAPAYKTLLLEQTILGPLPLRADRVWHVNLGWIDRLFPLEILTNLTVKAEAMGDLSERDSLQTIATIEHVQRASRSEEAAYLDEWDEVMNNLHDRNKAQLKALLTPAMCTRIGLD